MARHVVVFIAWALVTASGCAGSFGAGVRDYDHARYPEADEELRAAESDAVSWSPGARARYALYRGLTHLALGDRLASVYWLTQAKRALDDNPLLFSDQDAGRLTSAWS